MKKRYLGLVLASLFSISLVSCGEKDPWTCDPMFDDCDSNQTITDVNLKRDTNTNYIFEDVDNRHGSVSYEIFVRSFYDSNHDGIGDLNGVTAKIPYLKTLGVSNLWLMPIHDSPSYHGYDVIDYYSINKDYGTMKDFENLVTVAKNNGITIMIDMVLNHSSKQNEWFNKSYQDYKNNNNNPDSKKDYYVWSNTSKTGFAKYNDLYYEARFDQSMPDLNTKSAGVRKEIDHILKFWIDKGVKGFRLDAVKYYEYEDNGYNIEFLNFLKDTSNKYGSNIEFVGECWDNDDTIISYSQSKCDSFFNFHQAVDGNSFSGIVSMVNQSCLGTSFGDSIEYYESKIKENNPHGHSSYFLTNHDQDRASNTFSGENAYMAASLYLTLPGTPYIYYGEEIELKGVRNLDPNDNSDARRRLPMVWSKNDKTGECNFPESNRQDLALNNEQVELGVNDKLNEGYSLLNHYRKVINVRNKYPFLKQAMFKNLASTLETDSDYIACYRLYLDDEEIVVVHNFDTRNVLVKGEFNGYHIQDSISHQRLIPELKGNELGIGAKSTLILAK